MSDLDGKMEFMKLFTEIKDLRVRKKSNAREEV
jgi:hypothetical protein